MLLDTNMQQNLQIVVNVAKEYTEQLTAEKIIELLEAHKSYHGLYFYLGAHIATSENPEARGGQPTFRAACRARLLLLPWAFISRCAGLITGVLASLPPSLGCWLGRAIARLTFRRDP